jgi:hypothetical protein
MLDGDHNLSQEKGWALDFIGHHKVALTDPAILGIIFQTNPSLMMEITLKLAATCDFPPKIDPIPLQRVVEARKNLFLSSEFSDFVILLPNGEKVSVHKCILREWQFFESILIRMDSKIHDTPMPASTFRKLVAFFYMKHVLLHETDKNSLFFINFCDARWILHMADYYLLQEEKDLLKFCEKKSKSVTAENWKDALKLGVQLESKELQEEAIEAAVNSGVSIRVALEFSQSLKVFFWGNFHKLP